MHDELDVDDAADWMNRFRELRSHETRERLGRFPVEGERFLLRAIETGRNVDAALVSPEMLRGPVASRVVADLRQLGVPIATLSRREFHAITNSHRPSGLAAIVRTRWTRLDTVRGRGPWLVLEHVRSPGNLGTLLRTLAAVGGAGLIRTGPNVDPHHPAAVRATMGAHLGTTLVTASHARLRRWADRTDTVLIGACPSGEVDHDELVPPERVAYVLGDERKGLTDAARTGCDVLVRIPMAGPTDSLNLAVAGSVLLYEWLRRYRVRESTALDGL